jgi:glycosyltransferase involved in cell wall biosynthesis
MRGERIAFVRMGPHPIPNRLLPPELERRFEGCELRVLDVERAVRRDPISMLVNPLFVVLEHGAGLLGGRIRRWSAFFTTTWMFRRMSRLARRWVDQGDFDLSIQIQSLFDASTPGTPHFVYTDHTHLSNLEYPDFDRRTLKRPGWIELERGLYHDAAIVFTRSSNVSRTLVSEYGCDPERVATVGAGTNVDVTDRDPADPDAVHLLFVGVDWERKGGPELLAAFGALAESHPEARLTIVGCEPDIADERVRVMGRLSLEELPAVYSAATIFCMPTRREPFGVAFVEAMHHGLPIVATRVGALPDMVAEGETGLLADVGDVEALVEALRTLAGDAQLRHRMGEAARARARAGYTWRSVAERMETRIRRILGAAADASHDSRECRSREPVGGAFRAKAAKMG